MAAGTTTTAVFSVALGSTNIPVELWLGTDRVLEVQNHQLRQIPLSGPGYLGTIPGQTDINGICTWTVDLAALFSPPESVAYRNIFAQVGANAPVSIHLSNPVNVWVFR